MVNGARLRSTFKLNSYQLKILISIKCTRTKGTDFDLRLHFHFGQAGVGLNTMLYFMGKMGIFNAPLNLADVFILRFGVKC